MPPQSRNPNNSSDAMGAGALHTTMHTTCSLLRMRCTLFAIATILGQSSTKNYASPL